MSHSLKDKIACIMFWHVHGSKLRVPRVKATDLHEMFLPGCSPAVIESPVPKERTSSHLRYICTENCNVWVPDSVRMSSRPIRAPQGVLQCQTRACRPPAIHNEGKYGVRKRALDIPAPATALKVGVRSMQACTKPLYAASMASQMQVPETTYLCSKDTNSNVLACMERVHIDAPQTTTQQTATPGLCPILEETVKLAPWIAPEHPGYSPTSLSPETPEH